MATTVTIQPCGIYYKQESKKWENVQRLWDGDESTAPTSQSGYILLKVDLSFLPPGAWITQVTARYVCKRGSDGISDVVLSCTDRASYSSSDQRTSVKTIQLENGTYNVIQAHSGTVTLTHEESSAWLSKAYKLITLYAHVLNKGYEVYLDVTYEETASNLFVGADQAKEVYVGATKASAVYIGDTKVL